MGKEYNIPLFYQISIYHTFWQMSIQKHRNLVLFYSDFSHCSHKLIQARRKEADADRKQAMTCSRMDTKMISSRETMIARNRPSRAAIITRRKSGRLRFPPDQRQVKGLAACDSQTSSPPGCFILFSNFLRSLHFCRMLVFSVPTERHPCSPRDERAKVSCDQRPW